MKNIKKIILFLSWIAGEIVVPLVVKLLSNRYHSNNVVIVMYHGVVKSPLRLWNWGFLSEASFSRQIKYLKKNFDVINLSEVSERLKIKGNRSAAVITFDDGYQNNYDVAFPILRRELLPATIFITAGIVNTDDTILLCRLHYAFEKSKIKKLEWYGSEYNILNNEQKIEVISLIKKKLKLMPNNQMMAETRKIIVKLGMDPDCSIGKNIPFRMLSHKAIKEMNDSGFIEFGAHTISHPILSRLSYDEQKKEIEYSINMVEKITGRPCKLFAYPNGMVGDYTNDTIRILKNSEINVAVTANVGINKDTTSLLELYRYGSGEGTNFFSFIINVHNIKSLIKETLKINK